MEIDIIYIAGAAFIGGIISSLLGWLDSGEDFVPKKFTASLIRALVAGVGFAVAYQFTDGIGPIDLLIAFLGGAGVEAGGNRVSGAIKAALK